MNPASTHLSAPLHSAIFPRIRARFLSLEYDPDRAKALLKEARAVGTEVKIVCAANATTSRESAQVVQNQWTTIGFTVTVESLASVPYNNTRNQRTLDGLISYNSYRYDPSNFKERRPLA